MNLLLPPRFDPRLNESDNASVVLFIMSGLDTESRVTTSSYTRRRKCFDVGCESTTPHASIVASLGSEDLFTTIPLSSDHMGDSFSGSW